MDNKEIIFFDFGSKYFEEEGVIVDVGGFLGEWSNMARSKNRNKKIYIYEPNTENFRRLEEKFGQDENTLVKNLGVSSGHSREKYYKLGGGDEISQMSGFVRREVYNKYNFEEIFLETVSLDDEIEDSVDFLKIDTEGFEFEVLKGMENLLRSRKVKFIQFEYGGTYLDRKISLNEVISYLDKFGYKVYDLMGEKFLPIKNYTDDYEYNNFISTFLSLP